MPAFSRSSSSRIFTILGTLALLVLAISLTAGGFVLDIGPIRFSARQPLRPLLAAALAWAIALAHGPGACRAALAPLTPFLERHATALAIVIAAASAGVGVSYATYSASSADASGYVSQGALMAAGRVSFDEPLARQAGWPDSALAFAPLGYRPTDTPGRIVPIYAPGLPIFIAGAQLAAGELASYLVVPFLGGLGVLATYGLGVYFHSRLAGLIAATLLATSPIYLFQLVQAMSDVPAAALWAAALLCAVAGPTVPRATAAGAVAGLAVLVRPNLLPLAVPLALLAAGTGDVRDFRSMLRQLIAVGAGMAPAVAFQAWLQSHLYGSPLVSGYGDIDYAWSYVMPNLRGYTARFVTGEAAALALAAASLAMLVWRRQRGEAPARATRPLGIAAAGVGAIVLLSYLPYTYYPEWMFLRFLLPAFPLVFVVIAAAAAGAFTVVPRWARGFAVLLVLTAVAGANVGIARREQAFALRGFEARYRTAGRYLESALPPEAVILTVQESGSARYYAGRTVVRWDSVPRDLDAIVAQLTTMGRPPVLLIEEFETADFQRRFPASEVARLDWAPRADVGTSTRVRLFDPADRSASRPVVTDRPP